jgi:hypothetical protein
VAHFSRRRAISGDEQQMAIGAIVTLAGIVWGVAEKRARLQP